MSINLSYLDDLSRVRIELAGMPDGTAHVERSTNQLLWSTVRGGAALPVVDGVAAVDDYEFTDSTENHYRVTVTPGGDDQAELVGVGDVDTAASTLATLEPEVPGGTAAGDLILLLASAEIGDLNPPAGYDVLFHDDSQPPSSGSLVVFAKIAGAGETPPEVTCTGGDAAGSFIAQCAAFRNTSATVAASAITPSTNLSTISTPQLVVPSPGNLVIQLGWRSVTWTNTATMPTGSTKLDDTPGPSSGQLWAYRVLAEPGTVEASAFGNLNSAIAPAVGVTIAIEPADVVEESDSITPSLDGRIWLKSIRYPMLNRWVKVQQWDGIARSSRGSLHDVAGRSHPVAVTDLRASRDFTLEIATRDLADSSFDPLTEARDLDLVLASGDIFFVHVPAGSQVPGGYVSIGNTSQRRLVSSGISTALFTLPCTVVAPPSPQVVGAVLTWGTVQNLYGSWEALLAANPTWADLLATVGSPNDLVVL